MTESERLELDAWLHALDGPINPLFMIAPDHNEALFGRLASNDYRITHQGSYYNFEGVTFRSDPVGTIVTAYGDGFLCRPAASPHNPCIIWLWSARMEPEFFGRKDQAAA